MKFEVGFSYEYKLELFFNFVSDMDCENFSGKGKIILFDIF